MLLGWFTFTLNVILEKYKQLNNWDLQLLCSGLDKESREAMGYEKGSLPTEILTFHIKIKKR